MAGNTYIKMDVLNDDKEVILSSANVVAESDRLILKGADFKIIPQKTKVSIVGYLKDGLVLMDAAVTVSTSNQLNLNMVKTYTKQERRNFLKVTASVEGRLFRAFSMGRRKRPYMLNAPILTRDMSLGGIAFYCDKTLLKKQIVEIKLDQIKPGFVALAEVLRREKGFYRGGYYKKYACRLWKLSGEAERTLCEFVFRTQLENIGKLNKKGK